MRKGKYIIVLFLTVVFIAAGALLPQLAARMQDAAVHGKISYRNMDEISLQFTELSVFEKFRLLSDGYQVTLPESSARMSVDELRAALERELAPYYQEGLLQRPLSDYSMNCQLMLHYLIDSTELSNIFWSVSLYRDGEDWQVLELQVDDKTGKIMKIYHESSSYLFEEWELPEKLTAFYHIYLDALDLEDGKDWENANEDYSQAVFRWGDILYGETEIAFLVNPHHFESAVTSSGKWIDDERK